MERVPFTQTPEGLARVTARGVDQVKVGPGFGDMACRLELQYARGSVHHILSPSDARHIAILLAAYADHAEERSGGGG